MKEVIIIEYKIVKSNDDKYLYKVYEDGKIYDIVKDRIMPSHRTSNGYIATYIHIEDLCREIGVHRIVLCAFTNKSITYNMQVNHKDGNKENNSLDNLEWVTPSENMQHAYNMKLATQIGEKNSFSILTEKDVNKICSLLETGSLSVKQIAALYNVTDREIYAIRSGKLWNHISRNYNIEYRKRLTDEQVMDMCDKLISGIDKHIIAEEYGVSISYMNKLRNHKIKEKISCKYDFVNNVKIE